MRLGEVVGSVVATIKHPSLASTKLLIIEFDGAPSDRSVAVDVVGAGLGQRVLVASGTAARFAVSPSLPAAVDAAVVAIVDSVDP